MRTCLSNFKPQHGPVCMLRPDCSFVLMSSQIVFEFGGRTEQLACWDCRSPLAPLPGKLYLYNEHVCFTTLSVEQRRLGSEKYARTAPTPQNPSSSVFVLGMLSTLAIL